VLPLSKKAKREDIVMSDIKICPQCSAEYFAHAELCSSCEVPLVAPGEAPAAVQHAHDHDNEETGIEWPEGPSDVLMEAPLEILEEMGTVLNENRMPYEIFQKVDENEVEDTKSCKAKAPEYAIVVPKVNMEESIRITEEHWYKLHPEQVESDKRTGLNQCPACAADLNGSPKECPDCGLNLAGSPTSNHDNCC
jgi:hypothetical protein